MDISLLKTFVELSRSRHFGKTAKVLFITQSAVSARMRLLEEKLGVKLLVRDRNNIHLTPAGVRFQKHAEDLIHSWERAVQDTALEDDSMVLLSIGSTPSLWNLGLQNWLSHVGRTLPHLALNIEVNSQDTINRNIAEGLLDVGFLFDPPRLTELQIDKVSETELVLVSTEEGQQVGEVMSRGDYILVDWGVSFKSAHAKAFPELAAPTKRISLGQVAMNYLLSCGGSAYLAKSMLAESGGKLHIVEAAPVFSRDFYAAYSPQNNNLEEIEAALQFFRK